MASGDQKTMPICCGRLEEISKFAELPFDRQTYIDEETHDIYSGPWCVQLFRRTPSGNVSTKYVGLIALTFCPFCGKKITDKEIPFTKEERRE